MNIHLILGEDWRSMKEAVADAEKHLGIFGLTITTERRDIPLSSPLIYETQWSWSFLKLKLTKSLKPSYILGLAAGKAETAHAIGILVDKEKAHEESSLWGQQQTAGGKQIIEVYVQNSRAKRYGYPLDSYVLIHEIYHALADHYGVRDTLHEYQDDKDNKSFDGYREIMLDRILAREGSYGLLPVVSQAAQKVVDHAASRGKHIRIVEGYRTPERQTELEKQRPRVTKAKAWESMHQYRVAFDFVFQATGYNASDADWREIAKYAKSLGFEWGGDWKGFVDKPHLEMTFGKDMKAFKARNIDWKRYWQRLPVFTRDLSLGDEGEDVRELQRFLNKIGYRISLFGAGAPGSETTYFGRATEAALIAFQKEHAIEPAAGYFGKITREVLRDRYSLT